MVHQATATTRRVESHDPSLSDEANALLTAELQAVIGSATAQVDVRVAHRSDQRHATHDRMTTAGIEARILVVPVALLLVIVALVGVLGSTALMVWIAGAAVFLAAFTVVAVVWRMASEPDHVAPATAALLSEEGVGDPDRLFRDLLDEFRGGEPAAV